MKKPKPVIVEPRLLGHAPVPYVTPREIKDNPTHRLDGRSPLPIAVPAIPEKQENEQ